MDRVVTFSCPTVVGSTPSSPQFYFSVVLLLVGLLDLGVLSSSFPFLFRVSVTEH